MSISKLPYEETRARAYFRQMFPLYPYAVEQICEETTRIGGKQYRDALLIMAEESPIQKHSIDNFVREVNIKNVLANNLSYFAMFSQLWDKRSGVTTVAAKQQTSIPAAAMLLQKNKQHDSDEDVDDKVPVVKKKLTVEKPKKKKKVVVVEQSDSSEEEVVIVKKKKKQVIKEVEEEVDKNSASKKKTASPKPVAIVKETVPVVNSPVKEVTHLVTLETDNNPSPKESSEEEFSD
uniref:Uncharacterized protein n=1 Tax=viral metagenome TaxID=1070528 RepID=A0A6C0JRY5_9ZZZZ